MYSIYPLTVVPLSVSFLTPPACLLHDNTPSTK